MCFRTGEKPLTLNEKQTRMLIEAARANKVVLFEGLWSRFFPSYRHLKQRLDDKELGDIKEVEAEFGFDISEVARLQ